jgi:hypothetical protein
MQDNRKLAKSTVLAVVSGQKYESTRASGGYAAIYAEHQHFYTMRKHLRGSNRPAGWLHRDYGVKEANVRWLWTEENRYFGAQIEFQPGRSCMKLIKLLDKLIKAMAHTDAEGPATLIQRANAFVVEYVTDQKEGCWDDYRVIQAPGDSDMMIIARAAGA